MTAPTITALPALPSAAATFSDDADAFVAAIPTAITEMNAQAEYRAIHDPIVEIDGLAASGEANITKWISATDYDKGDVVWSPTDWQDYVRVVAGAGTTDPNADPVNWQLVTGSGDATTDGAETFTNKTIKRGQIAGRVRETIFTITDGASVDIDPADGTIQIWELGADRVPTASFGDGDEIALVVYGGGWTLDWSFVDGGWINGIEPSLTIERYSYVVLTGRAGAIEGKYVGQTASPTAIDLNFMLGVLDSRVTLTRASTGRYINSSGTIASAAIDTARLDYSPSSVGTLRGLLYEPQRTNLWTNSEATNLWSNTRASTTSNATTAPDGNSTADKVVEDSTASNSHVVGQTISAGATASFSFFAKAGERTWVRALSGTVSAYFDLTNGAVGTVANCTASIEAWPNGWYRCKVENFTTAASLFIALATGNGGGVYSGDGTSGAYIWGGQLEAAATTSSYIPTGGSQVTRSTDAGSFTVPSGVSTLRYTFDDNSTQDVAVSPGSYNIPTTLNRTRIKRIHSV